MKVPDPVLTYLSESLKDEDLGLESESGPFDWTNAGFGCCDIFRAMKEKERPHVKTLNLDVTWSCHIYWWGGGGSNVGHLELPIGVVTDQVFLFILPTRTSPKSELFIFLCSRSVNTGTSNCLNFVGLR